MVIAVFGATGRAGRRFVARALADGHRVRALARDPSRLPQHKSLQAIVGDVLDKQAVRATVEGSDAVIVTLGGGTTAAPGEARSQGMRNIVAAMTELGVRRVVALGGAGVLNAADGSGLRSERPNFPAVFSFVSAQHRAAWDALRDSSLDWTFVCPPDIPDGDATGNYRVVADTFPESGKSLTTGDLAAFMLRELVECQFMRHRVGIAT